MMADNDELRSRIRELEARNAALEAQLHEGGQMYHRALERARKLEALVRDMYDKLDACCTLLCIELDDGNAAKCKESVAQFRERMRELGIEVER